MPHGEAISRMPVTFNSQNRTPLYHQIFLILRSKIFDGEYRPGAILPGERELVEMFGVSRITAVRALNELAIAGLVVRERGRGTRVQFVGSGTVSRGPLGGADLSGPPITTGASQSSFDHLRDTSESEVTVHEFEYIAATSPIAGALQLPPGKPVQYAVRVWRFDGVPFNHITTYVPEDIGRHWTRRDLERKPLTDLLKQHGVTFGVVHERVNATLADMTLAERLQVSVGSPLLKIMRTTSDNEGRPVEYMIGFYPPERYQYDVTLPDPAPSSNSSLRRKANAGPDRVSRRISRVRR
jgi:GntR family transcriptional regulator